jgi:hypothetical protein
VKRRSARLHQVAVAEDQALVIEIAESASERNPSGEGAGFRKHPARQRRERQQVGVLAKNKRQHYALHF